MSRAFALYIVLMLTHSAIAGNLEQVKFDPPQGAQVDLSLRFTDEHGRTQDLRSWTESKPTLLAPVYFSCPNLCDMTLAGLAELGGELGSLNRSYQVMAVSIDPRETVASLRQARAELRETSPAVDRWLLLRGDERSIQALTRELGFGYFYDDPKKQFAHAAGMVVLNSVGKVTQFFPGVRYQSQTVSKAIQDAQHGRVEPTLVHRILLTCFDYDPSSGRYSLRIISLLRLAGMATMLLLFGGILLATHRERKRATP